MRLLTLVVLILSACSFDPAADLDVFTEPDLVLFDCKEVESLGTCCLAESEDSCPLLLCSVNNEDFKVLGPVDCDGDNFQP